MPQTYVQYIFECLLGDSLGIQSPCQRMIGVYNHLLSKVLRFHYHSQKVIGSLAKLFSSSLFFQLLLQLWVPYHQKNGKSLECAAKIYNPSMTSSLQNKLASVRHTIRGAAFVRLVEVGGFFAKMGERPPTKAKQEHLILGGSEGLVNR